MDFAQSIADAIHNAVDVASTSQSGRAVNHHAHLLTPTREVQNRLGRQDGK